MTLDATGAPSDVQSENPADMSEVLNVTGEVTFRLNGAVCENLLLLLIQELKR